MPKLIVQELGIRGVNCDKNPIELDDSELVHAQNVVVDPSSGASSIRKREGLIAFTIVDTADVVLGGCDLPLQDLTHFGTRFMYVGRAHL